MRTSQIVLLYVLALAVASCSVAAADKENDELKKPRVRLSHGGVVVGEWRVSSGGRRFHAYEGVPYARPPVGRLRFASPWPHDGWRGDWHARTQHTCLQVNHDPTQADKPRVIGTEDCLYANVYVPAGIKAVSPLPVIVHLHGGAFMFGSGHTYGPEHLMDRDVVYVTFNYRLGALGFLATEDTAAPGNAGLKDQTLALRWLSDEVNAWGGDAGRVLLTGMSAGGAAAQLHALSPLSRGLFHAGISFSGTALANWALVERPTERARRLADHLGCHTSNSNMELVECLRERPAADVQLAAKRHFQPWLYNPYSPWGPVVEPEDDEAFLPASPDELLAERRVADVPWLFGLTTHEGLYPAAELLYDPQYLPRLDAQWDHLAPFILHWDDTSMGDKDAANRLARLARTEYLGEDPITRDTYPALVQLIGDRLFVSDGELAARAHARALRKARARQYVFAWRGSHSTSELLAHSTEDVGVCHADDVMYMLSAPRRWYTRYMETSEDKRMRDALLDMVCAMAEGAEPSFGEVDAAHWTTVSAEPGTPFAHLLIEEPARGHMVAPDHIGRSPFWHTLPLRENLHLRPIYYRDATILPTVELHLDEL